MTAAIEYALLSGASYYDTREELNQFPLPQGWSVLSRIPENATSGFEATTFTSGNEIVISFAGTYLGSPADVIADADLVTGVLPGTPFEQVGLGWAQLKQAAEYYIQVKADNTIPGIALNITLTGHSLGGGLASLLAVFFDETAVTFDQAPFRNSANLAAAIALRSDLIDKFPATDYPQIADWLAPLDRFIWSFDPFGLGWSSDGLDAREANVTNTSVQGEIASTSNAFKIGTELSPLTHGDYFAPIDLHSQALLTAFLQSDQSATKFDLATGKFETLSEVTFKLNDLLGMIFDKKLFAYETDDPNNRNFLEHLVRHEAGVQGSITADAMVTRFTDDLWKLVQDGGMTMRESVFSNGNNVSKALIAFAMQFYYEDTANATNANKQLFTDLSKTGTGSNGIQFDMTEVSKDFATSLAQSGKGGDFKQVKGYQYFQEYLSTSSLLSPQERTLIQSLLPVMRDWYVQAGASGMNAADTLNRGAFMLGGNGSDALVGGTGADLLVGNAGNDILVGGQGNDTLLGGSGNDAYVYTTGDGLDTILDAGGQNTLAVDGTVLAGGAQYGDAHVHRDANKHLYVDVGQGNLIIDGNIVIQNYATGGTFNLTMNGAAAAPTGLSSLTGNDADNFIGMDVYNRDPNDSHIEKATNSNGQTWAGSSNVVGSNADILEGGLGSDIIVGGAAGGSRIYADTRIDAATAIANGNSDASINARGDWLAGSSGDDTLVGSASNDVLSGGGGADLLIGGAGNDDILGDTNYVATSFDWTVTDTNGTRLFRPVLELPAVGGADVIYAGKGNDIVQAAEAEMTKTTNGAIRAVLFGRAKPEAANDLMLLAA